MSAKLGAALGDEGRADLGPIADVEAALEGTREVTRAAALFHLWCSLEERPDHLCRLEAAVLAAPAAGQGLAVPAACADRVRCADGQRKA